MWYFYSSVAPTTLSARQIKSRELAAWLKIFSRQLFLFFSAEWFEAKQQQRKTCKLLLLPSKRGQHKARTSVTCTGRRLPVRLSAHVFPDEAVNRQRCCYRCYTDIAAFSELRSRAAPTNMEVIAVLPHTADWPWLFLCVAILLQHQWWDKN